MDDFAPPSLDEESVLEEACCATGLDDFGPDSFRPGLRKLIEALEGEAALSPMGRAAAYRQIVGHLSTRLRILDHRKRHPEVEAEEIRPPLFVIGLPRTGTTVIYGLLAEDPAHRAPLSWEVSLPCPPPEAETYETDPRIEESERAFQALRQLNPEFAAMHPVGARLPQECLLIHMLDFHSVQFEVSYSVPSYQEWLEHQDMRPTYCFHRWFLQHLQSRCRRERWVLKSPAHLMALDVLLGEYPDAMIVQTHRDPVDVAASVSSLHYALRKMSSERIDPREVGREQVDLWSRLLPRAMAVRDGTPELADRFFDLQYEDIVRDPLDCVRRIYSHFGLDLSADAEERMERFLVENPRDKHGTHRYTLDMFGLDAEKTAERFAAYNERFGFRRPVSE